jgi:hypothetical protein
VVVAVMLGFVLLTPKSARAQGVVLPLQTEDKQMIDAQLGPHIVGKALPSTPIEDPCIYFPLREKASIYQVTAGPNAGNTQTLSLGKITRPIGKSAWRFQFSPSLTGFIHQTPEGDLITPSVGDTSEGVMVVSTPANPFVVKGMKPGETRSYVQQVRVDALDDPTDQGYTGSLTDSYIYLGTYQVMVPAGTYGSSPVPSQVRRSSRPGPYT